jgi:hypothetical protein
MAPFVMFPTSFFGRVPRDRQHASPADEGSVQAKSFLFMTMRWDRRLEETETLGSVGSPQIMFS